MIYPVVEYKLTMILQEIHTCYFSVITVDIILYVLIHCTDMENTKAVSVYLIYLIIKVVLTIFT